MSKTHTYNTKKQTSVQLFHILSSRHAWPEVGPERYVALQLFNKFFSSSGTKPINLTFCRNWNWVLFLMFQNASKLRQFFTFLPISACQYLNMAKWLFIIRFWITIENLKFLWIYNFSKCNQKITKILVFFISISHEF